MSRLPTSASGIQPPRRLSRPIVRAKTLPTPVAATATNSGTAKATGDTQQRQQQQQQSRRKQQKLPPLRTPSLSRASISSPDELDSPSGSARLSLSSTGSAQTTVTSPRASLTSPKPSKRTSMVRIGDRVAVDSMSIVGTLLFLGPTQFKDGLWAGIQLDIVGQGKNDGSVQGIRYFSCPPQTGLFVQGNKIRALSGGGSSTPATEVPPPPTPRRASYQQAPSPAPLSRRTPTYQQPQQQRTVRRSLTELPPPARPRSIPSPISPAEDDHARLERILGEAIHQAPDEATLRMQQLQLRIEVLEAENKYLKLENTQNKTAEQILERSVLLGKGDFSLETHQTVVKEIKDQHEEEKKVWEKDRSATESTLKKLEGRVRELEAEQAELIKERDDLSSQLSEAKKDKSKLEQQVTLLEQKIQVADAAVAEAAKKAVSRPPITANFYSDDPEELRQRQMQMEIDLEEAHEKMGMITEQMRAKDFFLGTLAGEVEMHRNIVEEREREVRRIKADAERHVREKDRLKDEVKDLEDKWNKHQDCATKDEYNRLKRQHMSAKDALAHETEKTEEYRRRIEGLEQTVDELKKAGMESIELYESSVELHRVDMETIKASLDDERRKVVALESERENLKTAGLEAIETYESTIDELKAELAASSEIGGHKRQELQETIDRLKNEIDRLVNTKNPSEEIEQIRGVWESERKRLVDDIEALDKERATFEDLKAESDRLREQLKQADRTDKENDALREVVKRLQANYDEQLKARTKYLEDLRSAVESQKKTEGELRRLAEAKEKTERELATTAESLKRAESVLADIRKCGTDTDLLIKEREQHKKEIEVLRNEIEKLNAQNTMLTKQMESVELEHKTDRQWKKQLEALRGDNGKLSEEYEALMESNERFKSECTKLMDDMNRLHSDSDTLSIDANVAELQGCHTDQERVARLQDYLSETKQQIERLDVKHKTEIRLLKKQYEQHELKSRHQVDALSRDLSELSGVANTKGAKEVILEEELTHEREESNRLRDELARLRQMLKQQQMDDDHMSTSTVTTGSAGDECGMDRHSAPSFPKSSLSGDAESIICENCNRLDVHTPDQCPHQMETY